MCDKTLEDFLGSEHYNFYTERIKAKMKQREDRQEEKFKQLWANKQGKERKRSKSKLRRFNLRNMRKGTEGYIQLEKTI